MTVPLRVLMVEDSATDAKLVVQELQRTGRPVEFERVETAEAMRAALEAQAWDVVTSDWSMPRFTAAAALGMLKDRQLDVPFIIVSGTIGEEAAAEAMRAGAHDYVLKDKLGRLTPAVERELRECRERAAHHRADVALRESEARFGKLAESGVIGITIADIHGNILEANDAYMKMVGYSREELVSGAVRWLDLTPPEFGHLAAHAVAQLQASGVASPWETESFRKDGSRVPVLVGVAMLEYPRCIAFTADLTERNQAQAGRTQAEAALRQSEEQLRHAQKMEAIGRLAGGVAHDFNNVLSVILSYAELILGDLLPANALRADIEEIRKAASRAAGLTRQLLIFSRQQVFDPKVMDLHEVLASMSRVIQRILGEDVELVSLAPTSVGRIKADPSHIEQVILNLVVNARDAMPTGGKLTFEIANVVLDGSTAQDHLPAKTGSFVMMTVSDTGTGMDLETQARIFEPFFTTKERGKGTGLGLSTVFGIVQQSGGDILVDAELGKGTTFKIYLPRVDAEVDVLTPSVVPATLLGTETILLVEDEAQVRAVVLNILRRQGYRVIPAQHGAEALQLCEKHLGAIDLLLTDVVMPQMSGPELASRLAPMRPEMKVLCMSGYTDDSVARHGVLETDVAFLQKPFTPGSLTKKVRQVLDGDPVSVKGKSSASSGRSMTGTQQAGPRALVVDDDEALLCVHARALRKAGYQVEVADGGQAAVRALDKMSFDVVLSDIDMPDMNGLTLLERVRTYDLDVPVLLITGSPSMNSAVHAIEHGALRYLVKPVALETLVATADYAVRLHRIARAKRQALDLAGGVDRFVGDQAGLVASFGRALETLHIAFQPIVSWSKRSVFAYEALLRCREPSLPHPGAVLHAAERLGRVHDLGRAIRAKAIEPLGRLPSDVLLFVNLDSSDLLDEQLFSTDGPFAAASSRIVLEITERASLHALDQVQARVASLRNLGFRIALDDLGAGYAGLTSFALLEPDVVKLDMALVRDLHREPTKQTLVRTMITMCRELGIIVTGEGIETPEERDELARAGCDLMQGYLFAKAGDAFPVSSL